MRKASMILGIVGGSLAILGAIVLVFVSLAVGMVSYGIDKDMAFDKGVVVIEDCDEEGCPIAQAYDNARSWALPLAS